MIVIPAFIPPLAVLTALAGAAPRPGFPPTAVPTLFEGVTVLPMDLDRALPNRDVLVMGDRRWECHLGLR